MSRKNNIDRLLTSDTCIGNAKTSSVVSDLYLLIPVSYLFILNKDLVDIT